MISKRNLAMPAALLLSIGFCGCGPKISAGPSTPMAAPSPAPQVNGSDAAPSQSAPAVSDTPIKDSVEKLLAQQSTSDHPFIPRGTKLLSADFKDGVASLDFSHEFGALADRGDTVESQAQKALRRALAGINGVEKMRVTVEGKPFESQATDWNTPFAVRDADNDTDSREIKVSDRGGQRP